MPKIKSFTNLTAWKESHKLTLMVYKITKKYPKNEMYGLTDQSRRCSVSIGSNIAEGFSRQSKKDKNRFYYIAKGSLTELQNQLLIARDVGYISDIKFSELAKQTVLVSKLLSGLIKSSFSNK